MAHEEDNSFAGFEKIFCGLGVFAGCDAVDVFFGIELGIFEGSDGKADQGGFGHADDFIGGEFKGRGQGKIREGPFAVFGIEIEEKEAERAAEGVEGFIGQKAQRKGEKAEE